MTDTPIRIGMVGAGANTKLRHIPGFRAMPNVEIISVANRSRASGQRIADESNIPTVYDDWRSLVDAPDTNAIFIGTWPYLHAPITLAALAAGKHVLTEARMAMNATEARQMLAASRANPHLVTQIVPSPFTFKVDRTVQDLLGNGYLGDLLSVDLRATMPGFVEKDGPLQWRHDRALSGYNIMTMGIWYEALIRWVGYTTKVSAMTRVVAKQRRDADGALKPVSIPDHVDVLAELAMGGQAHMAFSAVTGLGASGDIWLFGSEGTLHWNQASQTLRGGRRGDKELAALDIPAEKQGGWRVEEEFIRAIRGEEKVTTTTFEDGVHYMEFTEAVTRSAQEGRAISLPL